MLRLAVELQIRNPPDRPLEFCVSSPLREDVLMIILLDVNQQDPELDARSRARLRALACDCALHTGVPAALEPPGRVRSVRWRERMLCDSARTSFHRVCICAVVYELCLRRRGYRRLVRGGGEAVKRLCHMTCILLEMGKTLPVIHAAFLHVHCNKTIQRGAEKVQMEQSTARQEWRIKV